MAEEVPVAQPNTMPVNQEQVPADSTSPAQQAARKVPPPSRHPGVYSGANPIPTFKQMMKDLDSTKEDRDKEIADAERAKKYGPKKASASPRPDQLLASNPKMFELKPEKGQKKVTDPTTGSEVLIEHASKESTSQVNNPTLTVPNANLGKDASIKTDPSQSGEEYRYNQDVTAPPAPVAPGSTTDVPIRGEKTNILFHPTPSVSYEAMFVALEKKTAMVCGGVFGAIIILGRIFGGRLIGLIPLAICVVSGIWLWMKEIVRSGREVEWSSEKERGQMATANLIPESVEWINSMLQVGWGMINPDMFIAVADTLEDVMQASVPAVIENIRVAEINQGSNPIRILSLRSLPDSEVEDLKQFALEENKKIKSPEEAAADEEAGDYYNLEAAIAYHAEPTGKRTSDKARNMHMQLVFYLGIKGLFGIPLPIFVELQSLVATARIRLHMTREPPYLKTLTFALMGVPHVQAGCIPMFEKGVNILNLPLISNFVNYAIGAAASMYVAPKSMILDMRSMLQGDDVTKDVHAIGVLWVRIHRAIGLSKQDRRGSKHGGSDPYITLAFSKYGKPMYCTRVITDDLQPIFEESFALLVTPELIQADENLSVELWDSDRHTADDIVGKVELSLQKMIQHPGKMFPQTSKLQGMDAGSEMPGELQWEIGYFTKPPFRPALRTDGKNTNLPKELRDEPQFQDDQGTANTDAEAAAQFTPPDPLYPSGIVSVIVHQIVNLELENIKGTNGNRKNREFEPAKPFGEAKEEQGGHLPTSYCTICLNDELVYRTRAKAISSQPIFNAGTERFIRDWKSAIVTVTVRDQRNREHDPILGVVPLKLSDILSNRSQVNTWYPLDGGIGFGRIRISLLFRSVSLQLPPNLLGYDVGTFEFAPETKVQAVGYAGSKLKLKMRTGGSTGAIPRAICESSESGQTWDLSKVTGDQNVLKLPVKYRYRSPVVFELHASGKRKALAYATFWLHHLADNEHTDIDIPIWTTRHPARLIQNHITEDNCRGEQGLDDLQEVGRLKFKGRFKAGMDESHAHFVSDNDTRETYETFEACAAEGVREPIVTSELPESLKSLHERSLSEGPRSILKKNADKHANIDIFNDETQEDKKRWLTKDGTNWSGAFGPNLNNMAAQNQHESEEDDVDEDTDDDSSGTVDLGIQDANNAPESPTSSRRLDSLSGSTISAKSDVSADDSSVLTTSSKNANKVNKRTEERKHRGLNQWTPVRNMVFAKNQSKLGLSKLKKKITGGLEGRQPGVESEMAN